MQQSYIRHVERMGDAHIAILHNGLRLIIQEDHRSPVAICNFWVRVGSNLEPAGVRGWAHGIEHLLFKGTQRRSEGDFAREVADLGGTTNAGTGYETTNYHITVPAEHLPAAVDILHDALFHAAFAPDALDAERPVLVHENHMYDDQPSGFGVTWRWAMELAHDTSPYRRPIGGVDADLLDTPRDRIVEFWRRAYRPDSMTLVVVGAVSAADTLELLAARLGPESAAPLPPLPMPDVEPRRDGCRLRVERGDLQIVYAKLLFPGLAEHDPDQPALTVLQRILADGRSARLYREVQEDLQLVSGITLLTESGPREGVLCVDLETRPETAAAALRATAVVLETLKTEGPAPAELERARIRTERSHAMSQETVQGRAANLGWHDLMGDLANAFDFPRRVAAVEADDVRRVCRRLFGRDGLTALLYVPQAADVPDLPADADALGAFLDGVLGMRDADAAPPPARSADAVVPRKRASARDNPFEELLLEGGLRLYAREDRTLPVLALGVYAAGGVCHETAGREGLAHLALQVQAKAAAGFPADTLHAYVESRGASISPFAARDHVGLSLTGLARHADELLAVMGALSVAPVFPAAELSRERRIALADLDALEDDPFQAAARILRAAVYPDHPYGSPLLGTPDSLAGFTTDDLRAHHARQWTRRNLYVVASGDFEPDALADRLLQVLADLPRDPALPLPDLSRVPTPDGVVRHRITRKTRQSVVLGAWRGPDGPNSNRAALALLQSLLNGQSGRLFEALRNRRSLCYATGLQAARGFAPGMIIAYVLTDPATEEAAAAALIEELERVAAEPAPREEFERARARLVGNLLIARQSNGARVGRCAVDVLYNRPPNNQAHYVHEIGLQTPEDVRATAERYLQGNRRWEVVLGPART